MYTSYSPRGENSTPWLNTKQGERDNENGGDRVPAIIEIASKPKREHDMTALISFPFPSRFLILSKTFDDRDAIDSFRASIEINSLKRIGIGYES